MLFRHGTMYYCGFLIYDILPYFLMILFKKTKKNSMESKFLIYTSNKSTIQA